MLISFKIAVAGLMLFPAAALAQAPPAAPPAATAAPVGHRQPTASDVPADDAARAPGKPQDSRHAQRDNVDRELGKGLPQICVGCGR